MDMDADSRPVTLTLTTDITMDSRQFIWTVTMDKVLVPDSSH